MEKTKSSSKYYHIAAIAFLVFGYIYTQVYMPVVNEVSGINEVTLAVKELWYVGMALFMELVALVNK